MNDETLNSLTPTQQAELYGCLDNCRDELLSMANVVAVGVGVKHVAGKPTGEPCVVVSVRRKYPVTSLGDHVIPANVRDAVSGLDRPTDVIEVGEIEARTMPGRRLPSSVDVDLLGEGMSIRKALRRRAKGKGVIVEGLLEDLIDLIDEFCGDRPPPRTGKFRPAPPGVSVGHVDVTAGTLGLWVDDRETGEPMLLSNNHVIANSNGADPGDPILQPGVADGGADGRDNVATLARWIEIRDGALVDAAVAGGVDPADVDEAILEIGEPTGWLPKSAVTVGTPVQKSGRTTGHTRGTINAVAVSVRVNYGNGRVFRLDDQIQITPGSFSDGGDSGSAILDDDGMVVGLLFAGSDVVTIGNQIQNVLELLDVEI